MKIASVVLVGLSVLGLGGYTAWLSGAGEMSAASGSVVEISAPVFESRGVGGEEVFSFQGLLTQEGQRVDGPIDLIFRVVDLENDEILSEIATPGLVLDDGLFTVLIPLPLAGDLGTSGSPAVVVLSGETEKPILEPIPLRRTPLAAASQFADFSLQSFSAISADSATIAGSADSAGVAEGLADQATALLEFTDGWTTTRFPGYATTEVTRVGGMVHLVGLPERTALGGNQILIGTLPEGFRPSGRLIFHCNTSVTNSGIRVDVLADGRITLVNNIAGQGEWVSLSGISFPVQ